MVKFDEEHDTKDCFPTLKMFHAFKSQRDAFYDLLENWKQNENQLQLNSKKCANIQKLLIECNGSVNMTKFAKLFVAQLINSSFEESKVNKLHADKMLVYFLIYIFPPMFNFRIYIKIKPLKSYQHQS